MRRKLYVRPSHELKPAWNFKSWTLGLFMIVAWFLSGCSLNTVKYDCTWKLKQQYNDPFIDVVECKK